MRFSLNSKLLGLTLGLLGSTALSLAAATSLVRREDAKITCERIAKNQDLESNRQQIYNLILDFPHFNENGELVLRKEDSPRVAGGPNGLLDLSSWRMIPIDQATVEMAPQIVYYCNNVAEVRVELSHVLPFLSPLSQ